MDKIKKQYNDTLFRTLFGDESAFLDLYNALADDRFPEETIVTPCQTNSLLARYNDLAFCIGPQLVVFCEHQSTWSVNLPLRLLRYVTDILYSNIFDIDKLYGSALVKIPTPKIFMLYNGEPQIKSQVLKLSNAFIAEDSEPALELTAKVVNINYGSGEPALNRCTSLNDYSFLIAEIRARLRNGMTRDEAIISAIDFCIEKGVLADFLRKNYQEVIKMLNYEYDAEAERRVLMQEGIEMGREMGREEGREEGREMGMDALAKLLREGLPLDVALEKARMGLSGKQ